ncbi:hypothetical protein [Aggregatilinea lenta]|uniref:hypothetical protein n=1 Tax=Aggregatilinea lenta TaxID=913108 RepID=UPI000E5AC894|nr:hypothetical protein [Aggregatilinea lenta]
MARSSSDSKIVRVIVYGAALLIVGLAIATMFVRVYLLLDNEPDVAPPPTTVTEEPGDATADAQAALQAAEQARADANDALERANEATSTLELLLSFLEGAAVLAGLALGATAYFGFRNLSQTNDELRDKLAELEKHQQTLDDLDKALSEQRSMRADLQAITTGLAQAHQELSLSNYSEAYAAARRVLARDEDNPQALYVAGWLELQFVPNSLDAGLEHLRAALRLQPDWPAAEAALGVGLRRKARKASGNERRDLFNQSDGCLRRSLGLSHDLLDLNRESFWGPVGGNARDTGNIEAAIAAYKDALKVTPGSSYPWGNLAALYMQRSKADPALLPEALQAFRQTLSAAHMELAFNPHDYFNMMDIAMAGTMLGRDDPAQFGAAAEMLGTALALEDVTDEMKCVSLQSGWQRLHKYCPDEWIEVKAHLQAAIKRVEAALAKPCPSPDE